MVPSTTSRLGICVSAGTFLMFSTLFMLHKTDAKWTEGTIADENGNWIFLTRFCFLSQVGRMHYKLEYPEDFATENLLFYYDDPGQWEAVYKRGLNCTQKVDVVNQPNIFQMNLFRSSCKSTTRGTRAWYECNGHVDFSSARERWWYLTVSRCGAPSSAQVKGLYLYYKLHMTNGDDLLHKEFSADEFYILLIDIIFFILYIKIMVLSIICAVMLKKKQLLHSTYKLYLAAVSLWTVHLLCMVIAWGSYGTTGWEMRRMEVLGRIIAAGSNIIFILMLILLAKGYTIVRGRLTNKAMIKITSFIFLYVIVSIALFIWEGAFFDPGLVLYYYESPPGYCLVAIILIGWLWFTKAAVFTLKHFKAKTNFYIAFYTIYTIWFWATPVIILVAMFSMAKWTREKTVNGVQQFVAYLGHLIFLILTMPNKVNTNFPYHIKTTQIGSVPDNDHLTAEDSARSNEGMSDRDRDTPGAYTLSSGMSYSGTGPNLQFFITTKADTRQAHDEGGRMYGPLDLNHLSLQEDSPPPGYSQVVTDDESSAFPAAEAKPEPGSGDSHSGREPNGIPSTEAQPQAETTPPSRGAHHVDYHDADKTNGSRDSNNSPTANTTNRLPPLRGGRGDDGQRSERAGVLPPIHDTSSRAIPTAPPIYEGESEGRQEWSDNRETPPAYTTLFRAKKS